MNKFSLSLLGAFLIVCGCTSPGASGGGGTVTGTKEPEEAINAPEAPIGDGVIEGKLEVVAFKGGYDIDFYATAGKEFEAKHPGLTVTVDGDPKIWEKIGPRMVSGDTPDIMFPGWGMNHWALVQDGAVMSLDKALDSPSFDGKSTWRETFDPNILKLCQSGGKTYMLPLYTMFYGWWYDPGLFAKNLWTPPRDWDELLNLCARMKTAGIAPLTFQGQYPYYMTDGMLLPWAASVGGIEAVNAAQNLEPGAWKSPAMLQAAKMIAELRDKGYFLTGSEGMSHTESQTQFLNGKAAMIPCGSWLESEMKTTIPPGVSVRFFNTPYVKGGKGDPTMALIGIEPWMIPSKAKNPNAAVAYYKYMTSLEKAKQFVEQKGSLMAIKGSDTAKLPESLIAPAATVKGAKTVWAIQYKTWYPEMQKEIEGALTTMLNKGLTPEEFCDRCEAAAEKTRTDDTIKKYKVN